MNEKLLEIYNYVHSEEIKKVCEDFYYAGTFEEFKEWHQKIYDENVKDDDCFESYEEFVDYERENMYSW